MLHVFFSYTAQSASLTRGPTPAPPPPRMRTWGPRNLVCKSKELRSSLVKAMGLYIALPSMQLKRKPMHAGNWETRERKERHAPVLYIIIIFIIIIIIAPPPDPRGGTKLNWYGLL